MPRARKHLVCLSETPYYHVTSRCVRRAFLCGVDRYSGKSYEHRRSWIEDRIRVLSSLFCIDICAYAVMSNHYHLVVKLSTNGADSWSDDEVLARWTALFRGPLLVQRYRAGKTLTPAEAETVTSIAAVYRSRLKSLSWFMKCLNEPIARKANTEDGCTGHFWEARFHSQPLTSERALLTAMAYVDLNPIRAGMAAVPEDSEYSSLRARLLGDYPQNTLAGAVARLLESGDLTHFETPVRSLLPFSDSGASDDATPVSTERLPMRQGEYLALVELAGRTRARNKRGHIENALQPILQRIGLTTDEWTRAATQFRQYYRRGDLKQTG